MNPSEIRDLASRYREYTVAMRREFHRHPEVSGREFHTQEVLIREIESMGLPCRLLDGTGMIAVIQGGMPGKTRVLRADIDALPIREERENLKRQKVCVPEEEGVCHACGHDAHMAMLLGAMKVLTHVRDRVEGTVCCCFEEGEETNSGIETMLRALRDYPVDECFALHVYSELDAGKINVVPGPRMAGTVGIGIRIGGRAGHASRPDQALSPIVPAAHIITQIHSAFVNRFSAEEAVTLGFGMLRAGEAPNVIPAEAYIGGTARFFHEEEGQRALALINSIAEHTAAAHGCTVEYEARHRIYPRPVVNDEGVALRVQNRVREICGGEVLGDCGRWYASESYSAYLAEYPGALGLLGIRSEDCGSGAAHHNGRFDIDESVLPLGVCAEVGFAFG